MGYNRNMRITCLVTVLCVFASSLLLGAAPVARVIGSEPLTVAGIATPARNAVPVSVGEEVASGRGVAVVQFRDGSSVSLQPNSALRIDGKDDAPVVRVVRGGVSYNLAISSRISVVNSRGETISRVLSAAIPASAPSGVGTPLVDPLATVSIFRANRQQGVVVPSTSVFTGTFATGGDVMAGASGSARVVLPNGLALNLNATTVNGVTTYTIASIEQTVGSTTLTITTDTSGAGLIGATVSGISGVASGSSVAITLTPSGSTTPISATTAANAIQTDVNNAVAAAVAAKTLPAGTTAPTMSPVETGEFFSASGS
jgi:hypothetical protein